MHLSKGFVGSILPYYELHVAKTTQLIAHLMNIIATTILQQEADALYEVMRA